MRNAARLLAPFAVAALPAFATLDVAGIDRSADPCVDFDAFANRAWHEATSIPPDRAVWGTFSVIERRNTEILERLLAEGARANPYPPGSNRHKIVAYYASGMDVAAIEKAGLSPIAPLLSAIDALEGPKALPALLARLHAAGIPAGFSLSVRQDAKDSRRYLAHFGQSGLGLPDRDYYFRDDPRSTEQRRHYEALQATLLELAGDGRKAALVQAGAALDIERALAASHMTIVERRDPEKTYNLRRLEDLSRDAPGFDWAAYLEAAGARGVTEVVVAQPAFLAAFAKLALERPVAHWKSYLRWHALNALAPKLPKAFEQAHFEFHQKRLLGLAEPPPRERRVIEAIGGRRGQEPLGHALGELFVAEAFPPEAKSRALELVGHVKAALRDRLLALDWMEDATRRAALDKLERMSVKIGYPDRWRDFSAADVGDKPFVANWLAASAFEFRRQLSQLGRPVDRDAWWMSPHIVNAYYGSRLNEIVFPAGILQPPFFDPKADDAANFGAIGMVIGHEITHGFDDSGRRFDAEGNLREWWTPADQKRYRERAEALVAQYDAYPGVDGLKVNGRLTLGENIADLGGLRIAYLGLQRALGGTPRTPVEGFTPEQRFFLSFAQSWRTRMRPEQERLRLLTDSHSPARYRVKGPLANLPEFAKAFSCPPGGLLKAESPRVSIW